MTLTPITHNKILTENFRESPFWYYLTDAMDQVINPCVQNPAENLGNIRDVDIEPKYAELNIRTLGFKIPSLAFSPAEYARVMRTIGTFWQTCGSSKAFINYLSYIKNVELIYSDLWANSLDMTIDQLTQDHGTELWNGGDWFPTSYFDITYSLIDFPNVDETQFRNFIYILSPMHLVLRDIVGIEATTAEIYLTAIPVDISRDVSIAVL